MHFRDEIIRIYVQKLPKAVKTVSSSLLCCIRHVQLKMKIIGSTYKEWQKLYPAKQPNLNPICNGWGEFAPHLSYFNIAPKLRKSFALMHPDCDQITGIFRKFGVSRTIGSDIIFAFVWGT